MKRLNWQIVLGLALLAASVLGYLLQALIFRDTRDMLSNLLQNLAFVPVQVLLVTLILQKLLSDREKQELLKKLNMIIGAFFSEVGITLLQHCSAFDPRAEEMCQDLRVTGNWSAADFRQVQQRLRSAERKIEVPRGDLETLRALLVSRRDFLVRLLENPNLLEHETFTDLLWAVFHLTEELSLREDLRQLPETDLLHLAGDIKRAYLLLVAEWLAHLEHLQRDYPYLFSLAVRVNPFDPRASVVVGAG
jgi:hypothetical protein